MKAEDIDNIQAGRELDALIHQHVFHFIASPHTAWPYSTNIADAWKVVESLTQLGLHFKITDSAGGGYRVKFSVLRSEPGSVSANTAPLAICRAALKAISAQQPEGEGK